MSKDKQPAGPATEFGTPSAIAKPPKEETTQPDQAAPVAPQRTVIRPTIGRRVWYWPLLEEGRVVDGGLNVLDHGQPCDAGVVFVHSAESVNLVVTDHVGTTHPRQVVPMLPAGCDVPHLGGVATWMP